MGRPELSFAVAVSLAGLSTETDVVALLSESFVRDNVIDSLTVPLPVTDRLIVPETAVPELSVVSALIVVAPVVLPALTIIDAVPLALVRTVTEAGSNIRSDVAEKEIILSTRGRPELSCAVTVSLAGLSTVTDVVGLLSESFVRDRVIDPVTVPVPPVPPVAGFVVLSRGPSPPHPKSIARNRRMSTGMNIPGKRFRFLNMLVSPLAQMKTGPISFSFM